MTDNSSQSSRAATPKSAAGEAFTPGPWAVRYGSGRFKDRPQQIWAYHQPQRAGGRVDITRWGSLAMPCSAEGRANARLIAAAPTMHSALDRIAQATPESTNSATIAQFQSWVRAVALTALADAAEGAPRQPVQPIREDH